MITLSTKPEYFTDSMIATIVVPQLCDIALIVSTLLVLAWQIKKFAGGEIVFLIHSPVAFYPYIITFYLNIDNDLAFIQTYN